MRRLLAAALSALAFLSLVCAPALGQEKGDFSGNNRIVIGGQATTLNAAFARLNPLAVRAPHIVAGFDSISAHNSICGPEGSPSLGVTAYGETIGWLPWALNLLGQPQVEWNPCFDNAGISGNTSTDVVARLPGVLARKADLVPDLLGTNDITSGIGSGNTPSAVLGTLKANRISITGQLVANGSRPVLFTLLPRGDAPGQTAAMRSTLLAYNTWLRGYAIANGFELFDAHAVLVDPNSTTGGALAGTLADGTHPNATGAFLLGQALAAQWSGRFASVLRVQAGALDTYDATLNPAGNLVNGARFTATTAMPAVSGLTTSGVIPSGFTFSRTAGTSTAGTVAGSVVADPDGLGQWFQLSFSGLNGTTETFRLQEYVSAGILAANDNVDGYGQVRQLAGMTGGATNTLTWLVADGSTGSTISYTAMAQGTGGGTIPTTAYTATQRIPTVQIGTANTNTTRILGEVSIAVSGGGPFSGIVQFRLPTLRKRGS